MNVICEGEVTVERGHAKEGMVVDFAEIKRVWVSHIKPLVDHQDLNETLPISTTTAENIACWVAHVMRVKDIPVKAVEVWETETSMARVEYSEVWRNGE